MSLSTPVEIRPSRLAVAGWLGLAGTAVLSLVVVPMPHLVQGCAAVAVVAVCGLVIRRHALLRSGRSISAIQPLPQGECVVKYRSGEEAQATILPDSVVWPWMLLLRIAPGGRGRPSVILLARDSLAEEDWRRLSIWLRWQASEDAG